MKCKTVRIEDGKGSFIVINESDLTDDHVIYDENKNSDWDLAIAENEEFDKDLEEKLKNQKPKK